MDEQSGESEKEEVMGEGKVSRKWRNWYQNKVDEEIKGVDFINAKHNGRSDHVILREDDEGGRARVTTDEERVLRGR